ncbi:hypothetical protein B0T20DRAFT_426891 [Sordaria brevicollis]|uniref:Secreted protein n=1 Tax=Sordaria brevicollis TaxID=83679 RepID=A0AAE0NVA3_SORBR|nr:hypothetical protein B0T20DRAFT_426891 [Sordaria brevicollis]
MCFLIFFPLLLLVMRRGYYGDGLRRRPLHPTTIVVDRQHKQSVNINTRKQFLPRSFTMTELHLGRTMGFHDRDGS